MAPENKAKIILSILVSAIVILTALGGLYGQAYATKRDSKEAFDLAKANKVEVTQVKSDSADCQKDIQALFKIVSAQAQNIEKLTDNMQAYNKEINEKQTEILVEIKGLSVKIENIEKTK